MHACYLTHSLNSLSLNKCGVIKSMHYINDMQIDPKDNEPNSKSTVSISIVVLMDRVVSFLSRLVFTHRMAHEDGSGKGDEGEGGDEVDGGGAVPSTSDLSPTLLSYYLVNSW